MLLYGLLALAAVFAFLTLVRLGGARRADIMRYWPALILGVGSVLAFLRGGFALGAALAAATLAVWAFLRPRPPLPDVAEAEARALLGVGASATKEEIRAAYRAKMRAAHPDRGGSHEMAARLTAARDRLLK